MSVTLPRYVVQPKGRTTFYWQVPAARRVVRDGKPWPKGVTRLPDDPVEMEAEAARLNATLDEARGERSIAGLVARYEASPYFTELAPKTQSSYREMARHVLAWPVRVEGVTTPAVLALLAPFDDRRSLRDHLAGYLGVLFEYARRTGVIQHNPARRLGLKKARRSKPIRIVDVPQMLAIVAKARDLGLPHVAMGVLLHFDLGQRQGDVLKLRNHVDYRNGVFQFEQSKTDQHVTIKPFLAETRAALSAVPSTQFALVADESGRQVAQDRYQRDFRTVANAAGFPDLWEMELRHSCVIFCERAGLTPGEIATRTGHSLQTVIQILERYRYRDSVVAAQGAVKLEDYRLRHAPRLVTLDDDLRVANARADR